MNYYSQKDWRWGWRRLGFSTLLIRDAGCLLTCYASIAGIQPDELNNRLKALGGYASANLIIHSKIYEATYRRIKFVYRHTPYNNTKVLAEIKKNGFCIVKLSNGTYASHWVVFIGGGKMIDPINGKVEPTGKYGKTYQAWLELKVC